MPEAALLAWAGWLPVVLRLVPAEQVLIRASSLQRVMSRLLLCVLDLLMPWSGFAADRFPWLSSGTPWRSVRAAGPGCAARRHRRSRRAQRSNWGPVAASAPHRP